ncbi:MAG: diguanylate cyclase [Myxococcales bacterium]
MPKTKTAVTVISKISERPIPQSSALVVIYGIDLGRKYELDTEEVVIGRSSKCDIQIDQESISRNHAKIRIGASGITIEDMGSTNGTFVNDELVVKTRALQNGDYIKIGRSIFKYIAGGNIEAQYHEEIYRLTTVDGLTQVFNKRYFTETLEREISRCHRYGRQLSLVLLDIDRFKQINDEHGHLAGDYVLKQLASILRSKVRREDVLARFGGEEFALILPELDLKQAVTVAEKLRKLVEKQQFVFDDEDIPVTFSAGVGTVTREVREPGEFVKHVDARLYEAKRAGRNRVCS